MPTTRYVLRRSSRAKLTHRQELELWLGPTHNGSSFQSDEHRRAAWFHHRARLMQWFATNGRRRCGWWWYEAASFGLPSRHPGVHQQSILYEFSSALREEERAELERFWCKEFEKSWSPNFSYFKEGRIFTGDVARELHWLWADIPPPLVDRWREERGRGGRVGRELQEENPPAENVAEGI